MTKIYHKCKFKPPTELSTISTAFPELGDRLSNLTAIPSTAAIKGLRTACIPEQRSER
jgi:hypothetical protein